MFSGMQLPAIPLKHHPTLSGFSVAFPCLLVCHLFPMQLSCERWHICTALSEDVNPVQGMLAKAAEQRTLACREGGTFTGRFSFPAGITRARFSAAQAATWRPSPGTYISLEVRTVQCQYRGAVNTLLVQAKRKASCPRLWRTAAE